MVSVDYERWGKRRHTRRGIALSISRDLNQLNFRKVSYDTELHINIQRVIPADSSNKV